MNTGKTRLLGIRERIRTPYLNFYTLEYENRISKQKNYEMVSKQPIHSPEDLPGQTNGVAMIVLVEDKLLLLKEFRMAVNNFIYNLPAGTIEKEETVEECAKRELFEETGLTVKKIIEILPASYGAVDITNARAAVVFLEAEGELSDANLTEDEEITPILVTRKEAEQLIKTAPFSGRAQMAAWSFANRIL